MHRESPAPEKGVERLHHLRLLASALSGRPLEVSPLGRGERPWTDGMTVYLDPDADPSTLRRTLAVQASLLRAGSLDPEIVRRLGRRFKLTRRYLRIEAHRALVSNGELLPDVVRELIDHSAAASTDSAVASLRLAEQQRGSPSLPSLLGEIRPTQVLDLTEALDLADSSLMTPNPAGPSELTVLQEGDDAGDEDDPRNLGHALESPVGGGGPIGRILGRLLTSTRSRGKGGGPVGADSPTHVGQPGETGRGTVLLNQTTTDPGDADAPPGSKLATYPEWDEQRGVYRPDWCTVVELEPKPEDRRPMALPHGLGLRRPLARLGIGLERQHRMPQGDDLDVDAVVEARVQTLARSAVPDGVYVETVRRRRDLSVLVLLDISGSAGEPAPGARTVHDHQRVAAAGLTAALHELGDRVALHAFNSRGRNAVQLVAVKRFDAPFDSRVLHDLGGLAPAAFTRLGAAIRHGAAILERDGGTPRRLLVVLSDGFAYDSGYEGRYGEADARRALAEARRSGVGCICLSVGTGTNPVALRRVFGTAAHASVPTADQLSMVVAPLFAAAIRSAEAQRRVFQRTERTRELLELERIPA